VSADAAVRIVPFRDELAPAFDRLNREWLARYFTVEPLDEAYLTDPRGKILARGGEVFFALLGETVIGTCAAIPQGMDAFELMKLGVAPEARGRGVGRALVARVITYARERGATQVVLWSASRLAPAIRIYASLGFIHTPFPGPPPYEDEGVDIYMTLDLAQPSVTA
jgi:GNAT superfamily N-acetyltransferase